LGIDPSAVMDDEDEKSAMQWAVETDQPEIVEMLMQHGALDPKLTQPQWYRDFMLAKGEKE